MIYLLWISSFLMTYVCGRGFLTVIGLREKNDFGQADHILTGVLICIGIAEAAHLAALFLHRSLSECMRMMGLLYIAAFFCGACVIIYDRIKEKHALIGLYKGDEASRTSYYLGFVAIVIIVIQFVIIQVNEHVYLGGDMTVETVNTFLYSDGIYTVNPLTGAAYSEGVPLRIRILCLPTLYAFFAAVFHMNAAEVVWQAVPAFVLFCTYMAFWCLAKQLFPENNLRRNLFWLLAAFLLTVGDYKFGMDGFLLLQSGFRGVAVRSLILMPYTINMALRKKWLIVGLCILAEACIAWTLYGAGVCLLAAAGIRVTGRVLKKWKKDNNN